MVCRMGGGAGGRGAAGCGACPCKATVVSATSAVVRNCVEKRMLSLSPVNCAAGRFRTLKRPAAVSMLFTDIPSLKPCACGRFAGVEVACRVGDGDVKVIEAAGHLSPAHG